MNTESRIETGVHTTPTERIGGIIPGVASAQPQNAAPVPPAATPDFTDPAKHRRERIKKLEARLQREIARDNSATRKERNGQLFVWGVIVEGVYRDGDAQEREQLRQWAKRKLSLKDEAGGGLAIWKHGNRKYDVALPTGAESDWSGKFQDGRYGFSYTVPPVSQ